MEDREDLLEGLSEKHPLLEKSLMLPASAVSGIQSKGHLCRESVMKMLPVGVLVLSVKLSHTPFSFFLQLSKNTAGLLSNTNSCKPL